MPVVDLVGPLQETRWDSICHGLLYCSICPATRGICRPPKVPSMPLPDIKLKLCSQLFYKWMLRMILFCPLGLTVREELSPTSVLVLCWYHGHLFRALLLVKKYPRRLCNQCCAVIMTIRLVYRSSNRVKVRAKNANAFARTRWQWLSWSASVELALHHFGW